MTQRRNFVLSAVAIGLSGCGIALPEKTAPRPLMIRSYSLEKFQFSAMPYLIVSESESFYPTADIVWRGDPLGSRVDQIRAMFEVAASRNHPILRGATPIALEVNLVRFHGVTNRTRYTIGGVYNVVFDMTVRHAGSGEVIEPVRRVVGNLDAPGGERAVRLEETGQPQKVRVTDFLTTLLRAQLV